MIENMKVIFYMIINIYVCYELAILILVISIEILWIFILVSKTLKSGVSLVGNFSSLYPTLNNQHP